jgi:hypothetical protein
MAYITAERLQKRDTGIGRVYVHIIGLPIQSANIFFFIVDCCWQHKVNDHDMINAPAAECNTFWYAHVTFVDSTFNVNPHLFTRVIRRNDFNLWPVRSKLSESSETFQLDISGRQSFTRLPHPRWTLHCRKLAKFKRRYHVCRSSPKSLFTRFNACKCV